MAISFIGSNTGHTTSSSEQLVVSLPVGVAENDIVIVAVGGSRQDWAAGVLTDGYEEIAELYATSTNTINLSLNWKRMGATPDTEVTCLASGQSFTDLLCIVYVLRGVSVDTALDVAAVTATGSGDHDPNPPAITPVTDESFIVICGGCSNYLAAGGDASVTAPSGYTNQVLLPSTNVTNDSTMMMASKAWTGGTEDPGAWDVDVGIDGADAWAAITIALRPYSDPYTLSPGVSSLSVVGQQSDVVIPGSSIPASLSITGQTSEVLTAQLGNLAVTLPTLAPLFQALGNYATLNVRLPTLVFAGATSSPSWLDVDLPTLVPAFAAGTALTVDLPFPEVQFSAVVGATCALDVDLPTLVFSAGAGAAFALDLPDLAPLFTSTTGSVASLNVTLPAFAALFTADVENLAQLVVHLPDLLPAFSSHQQVLSQLIVELPPLSVLFSGSAGEAASLHVTLPELQVLLTSYEEITGQMVVVLPALKALFSAAQSGRFDTTTALQLDGTVLRYRRPV